MQVELIQLKDEEKKLVKKNAMNEWRDYQLLVLSDLENLKEQNKEIQKALSMLNKSLHLNKTEIAILKVKSSLWGSLGGSLTVGLYLFYEWVTRHIKT